MLKQYLKIDGTGSVVMLNIELPFNQRGFDSLWLEENEEVPDSYIEAFTSGGFHYPRWNGTEWTEGLTQEEIDAEKLLSNLIPTAEQIKNAELEIKILTLLQEVMI